MKYLKIASEDGDRAVYKHHDFSRFYRGEFKGIEVKYQGMKVYQCKTLKKILEIRQSTFDYCGEWFDVYDENGKVNLDNPEIQQLINKIKECSCDN